MATTSGVSKGTGITNYQDLDGLLKDFYGPRIVEQLNNRNWALDRLEQRKDMKWSGRKIMFPIHTKRNTGVGFRGETGTLPLAGGQNYAQAEVTDVLFYGTIQLTGLAMDSVLDDKGGFRRALESEMKGLVTDARDHMGVQIWSKPVDESATNASKFNGVRGKVTAYAGGTTTVKVPLGYSNAPTGFGGTRYLKVGDILVWGTQAELAAGATPSGYGSVDSIDTPNQQCEITTLGGTTNPAVNDYVVRGHVNSDGNHEFERGINGLGALTNEYQVLASQELQNVAYTSGGDYTWQTRNVTGAGPFDENEIHQMIKAVQEVADGEPTCLISHYSMYLEYLASLQSQTRYAADSFKGGYQVLKFASDREYDWIIDKYCPYGHLFAIDEESLFWAMRRDFHWDDKGGSVLKSLAVSGSGSDAVRGFYKAYMNLAYEKMNTHGILHGVTVSGTVL